MCLALPVCYAVARIWACCQIVWRRYSISCVSCRSKSSRCPNRVVMSLLILMAIHTVLLLQFQRTICRPCAFGGAKVLSVPSVSMCRCCRNKVEPQNSYRPIWLRRLSGVIFIVRLCSVCCRCRTGWRWMANCAQRMFVTSASMCPAILITVGNIVCILPSRIC